MAHTSLNKCNSTPFATAFSISAMVISYGAPSRSAITAVKKARNEGIKAGYIKIDTVWPFPEEKILEASKNAQKVIVVELNLGKIGGGMQLPDEILERIKSV